MATRRRPGPSLPRRPVHPGAVHGIRDRPRTLHGPAVPRVRVAASRKRAIVNAVVPRLRDDWSHLPGFDEHAWTRVWWMYHQFVVLKEPPHRCPEYSARSDTSRPFLASAATATPTSTGRLRRSPTSPVTVWAGWAADLTYGATAVNRIPEANATELAALLRESHWLPNWLPSLQTKSISDQSGRRDLNPRPLDPQILARTRALQRMPRSATV
jgi:hypothetical protein